MAESTTALVLGKGGVEFCLKEALWETTKLHGAEEKAVSLREMTKTWEGFVRTYYRLLRRRNQAAL